MCSMDQQKILPKILHFDHCSDITNFKFIQYERKKHYQKIMTKYYEKKTEAFNAIT